MSKPVSLQRAIEEALGLSAAVVEHLLSLEPAAVWKYKAVRQITCTFQRDLLKNSQNDVQLALAAFYKWLHAEQGMADLPIGASHGAETASTWTEYVLALVDGRLSPYTLTSAHIPLSRATIEHGTPELLAAIDTIEPPDARQEWLKAAGVLCLLLVVTARQKEQENVN